MGTYQRQPDGSWTNATPLAYAAGYDVEVGQHGDWQIYRDGDHLVAAGRNRSLVNWDVIVSFICGGMCV
jgi:hypothetical protein